LRDALVVIVAGTAIGIAAAVGVTRFAESLLYGVPARDALSTLAAAFLLGLVALLASYVPARRASRLDPNVALRYE